MFKRIVEKQILGQITKKEIVILNGPRRVGKTTLLKVLINNISGRKTAYFDFTDPTTQQVWESFSKDRITSILEEIGISEKGGVLFFDEIQYFDNIGILFKLFYDYFPKIKIIATGSSSFLFMQNIGDSLTGRKKILELYPLSLEEINRITSVNYWLFKEKITQKSSLTESLFKTLVYGSYPEVVTLAEHGQKIDKLKEMADSYLFKDLLMIEGIKKPRIIVDLARLLAYQISNLVNPNEIATTLGISRDTVLHYIDLLEKFFIVYRVYPYERNLRDVIKKKFKVYFFDLGIRNTLIGNFSPLLQRQDKGFMLENAVMTGLKRRISYDRKFSELYFWRDYDEREIDIVIKNELVTGYEVKWKKDRYRVPTTPIKIKEVIESQNAYRFVL